MNNQDYIICSAIHFDDGKKYVHIPRNIDTGFVVCGRRHHDCYYSIFVVNDNRKLLGYKETQGFLTANNMFLNREEAYELALQTGQLKTTHKTGTLFSEDLY